MKIQSSFKIWEGPSAFNNEQISLILTGMDGSSENPKTGAMIQSWILPTKIHPVIAVKQLDGDNCCCGDCPLKPLKHNFEKKQSCYVARYMFRAPRSVWDHNILKPIEFGKAMDTYSKNPLPIRYGSYGDIAMIPKEIFKSFQSVIEKNFKNKNHTAYTHQHKHSWAYWTRRYAMASVENKWDGELFRALGWRTFRITEEPEAGLNEIICPNYTHKISCIKCGLCDGKKSNKDNRKSITIPRH